MTFATPDDTATFSKRCRARTERCGGGQMRGARLFTERSRPFVERIEAYWPAATQRAEKPLAL